MTKKHCDSCDAEIVLPAGSYFGTVRDVPLHGYKQNVSMSIAFSASSQAVELCESCARKFFKALELSRP